MPLSTFFKKHKQPFSLKKITINHCENIFSPEKLKSPAESLCRAAISCKKKPSLWSTDLPVNNGS
jgi:hypothetical protein